MNEKRDPTENPLDKFVEDHNISVSNEPDKKEREIGGTLDNFCKENNIDVSNSYYDINHNLDRYLAKNGISCSSEPDTPQKRLSLDEDLANELPKSVTNLSEEENAKFLIELENLELNIDDEEIPIDCLLKNNNGIGFLPTGAISMTVAPPKYGKSTFLSILAAAILGCGKQWGFYAQKTNAIVLNIDTEQDKAHQQRNYHYVFNMCKKERMSKEEFKKRYHTIHALGKSGVELKKFTEFLVRHHKPDFVIIDGVAQMEYEIMDHAKCAQVCETLLLIGEKYKCNVMCVIHTPKQKNNETDYSLLVPKGSLGTMLMQAMTDRFTCIKKDAGKPTQYFIVKHESRDEEIKDIYFSRDSQNKGMPKPYYETKENTKEEKVCNAIRQIFADNGNIALQKGDLIKMLISKTGYGKTTLESKWDEYIKPMEDELFINKDGRSTLIKLKDPRDPEQTEFNPIAEPDQTPEDPPF
jgi:hypothetical protein